MPLNLLKKYLSQEDLDEISKVIASREKSTSGEIRVSIVARRGFFEKKFSPRELAIDEFFRAGMDKTRDGTGVLIFILFSEHKFEIVADKGIDAKITPDTWDDIKNGIITDFKDGNYLRGITVAVNKIGDILQNEFPVKDDDTNELSDDVIVR